MDIRVQDLNRFKGGQIEIKSPSGRICRGEIESIQMDKKISLTVTIAWAGEMKDGVWVYDPELTSYKFPLYKFEAADLMFGRIVFMGHPSYDHDLVILFPKNGECIKPSDVQGLAIAA